jgi:hypothetical protein
MSLASDMPNPKRCLAPEAAARRSAQAIVSIAQQGGNIQPFGAAGQAVATVGAAIAPATGKPVSRVFKHAVAVGSVSGHVIGHRQISQPQHFGNVDVFGAGQAGVALAALVSSQSSGLVRSQPFQNRSLLICQRMRLVCHCQRPVQFFRLGCAHTQRGDARIAKQPAIAQVQRRQGAA